MDALSRADREFEHALAQRDGVVTPDTATSPMDEDSTVQIPRAAIADAETTLVMRSEPPPEPPPTPPPEPPSEPAERGQR